MKVWHLSFLTHFFRSPYLKNSLRYIRLKSGTRVRYESIFYIIAFLLGTQKLRQMYSIPLTSVQKLRNICLWQKCGICGFWWCCSKMADKEFWPLLVVGLDEVTTDDNLCPNFVSVTLKFEIIDFFQHPPFFHKKWLINMRQEVKFDAWFPRKPLFLRICERIYFKV